MSLEKIINWNEVSEDTRVDLLERPTRVIREDQNEIIEKIFAAVMSQGDKKLREYTKAFDNVEIDSIEMTDQEIHESLEQTPKELKDSIRNAIENIKSFHESFSDIDDITVETVAGVKCSAITRPIEKVGLYVPAGNNPLPSTAMMLGVPSMIAGCPERVLVSPPNKNGVVDPTIVTVAHLCNINRIFKIGGAQAIAALAFGTESVPQVNKIFGPGNSWVTQAKRLISSYDASVSIDIPAGPTEVLIIADGNSDPLYLAFDLLSQAEHGVDSQVILLSTSQRQLYEVQEQIKESLKTLSTREVAEQAMTNSKLILVDNLETAVNISNEYAPEHLILSFDAATDWLSKIKSAGSVFLGMWSPESAGDYCSGTNHVLPTGGFTKSLSGITVASFQKTISVQEITKKGLGNLSNDIVKLARAEGLEAHARAVEVRVSKNEC